MSLVGPNDSRTMQELKQKIWKCTDNSDGINPVPTAIEGLRLLRSNEAHLPGICLFKPALYMTLQGAKWATFHEKRYKFGPGQGLMVAVDVPARGTVIEASAREPYLGLEIELDFAIVQQLAEGMGLDPANSTKTDKGGAFVFNLSRELIDCAHRALRLLEAPEAIPMIYPGIMRELCYWLLRGPGGTRLRQIMTSANGHDRRIIRAIHAVRNKFSETFHVSALAVEANMSQATFHRQFKSVTGMTPLQYQKQLRLHEARRLLIFSNATVESAATDVGYSSVSQFSREYARTFGASPRRDVTVWRRAE